MASPLWEAVGEVGNPGWAWTWWPWGQELHSSLGATKSHLSMAPGCLCDSRADTQHVEGRLAAVLGCCRQCVHPTPVSGRVRAEDRDHPPGWDLSGQLAPPSSSVVQVSTRAARRGLQNTHSAEASYLQGMGSFCSPVSDTLSGGSLLPLPWWLPFVNETLLGHLKA